jgi:hypothetical protein
VVLPAMLAAHNKNGWKSIKIWKFGRKWITITFVYTCVCMYACMDTPIIMQNNCHFYSRVPSTLWK